MYFNPHMPKIEMVLQRFSEYSVDSEWTGTFLHVAIPRVGDEIDAVLVREGVHRPGYPVRLDNTFTVMAVRFSDNGKIIIVVRLQ